MTPREDVSMHTALTSAWQNIRFLFQKLLFQGTSIFCTYETEQAKKTPFLAMPMGKRIRGFYFFLCFFLIFLFLPLKAAFQGNFESETSLSWECLPGIPQEPSLSPTCLCAEQSNHCSSATRENTHCRMVRADRLRLRNER